MIIFNEGNLKNDYRHTVATESNSCMAWAVQLNEDGTYEDVTYMIDDMRTWGNEAIVDATEEEKEAYRKFRRKFRKGDKVIINRGRKMRGEIKEVKDFYTFRPEYTYGHCDTNYLVFTDGTKVNRLHCDFI